MLERHPHPFSNNWHYSNDDHDKYHGDILLNRSLSAIVDLGNLRGEACGIVNELLKCRDTLAEQRYNRHSKHVNDNKKGQRRGRTKRRGSKHSEVQPHAKGRRFYHIVVCGNIKMCNCYCNDGPIFQSSRWRPAGTRKGQP